MGLQGTIMAGPLYCPFRQPTCNVIWACSELDRARDQHRYFAPAATVYGSAHAKGQRSALCTPRPLQHSPLRDFPALCSFIRGLQCDCVFAAHRQIIRRIACEWLASPGNGGVAGRSDSKRKRGPRCAIRSKRARQFQPS